MNETKITLEYLRKGFENWKLLLEGVRTAEGGKNPLEVKFLAYVAQQNQGVYQGRIQAKTTFPIDKTIYVFHLLGTNEKTLQFFINNLLNKLIEGDREDETYLFAVEKIYGISPAEIQEKS